MTVSNDLFNDLLGTTLDADQKLAGELDPSKAVSKEDKEKLDKADKLRENVAAVANFVRSQELNRSLSALTLDHYIDQAKRRIKGDGRAIKDAAGEAFDTRPSQLDALSKLEQDFNSSLPDLEQAAQEADKKMPDSRGRA